MSKSSKPQLRVIEGGLSENTFSLSAGAAPKPSFPNGIEYTGPDGVVRRSMPSVTSHQGPQPVSMPNAECVNLQVSGAFSKTASDLCGERHYRMFEVAIEGGGTMSTWVELPTKNAAPDLSALEDGQKVMLRGDAWNTELYRNGDIPIGHGQTSVVINAEFVVV